MPIAEENERFKGWRGEQRTSEGNPVGLAGGTGLDRDEPRGGMTDRSDLKATPSLAATDATCDRGTGPLRAPEAWRAVVPALLLLLLFWQLLGGFVVEWLFLNPRSRDGTLQLDSFSPPSVALAILKREAHQLLVACVQKRERTETPHLPRPAAATSTSAGDRASLDPSTETALRPQLEAAITSVTRLDAQIKDLSFELDCRFLAIAFENRRYHEFVDHYLHLVLEAPGRAEVLLWWSQALDCAQECGRTEELTDALRHVIRFREDCRNVREVARLFEQRGFHTSFGLARTQP